MIIKLEVFMFSYIRKILFWVIFLVITIFFLSEAKMLKAQDLTKTNSTEKILAETRIKEQTSGEFRQKLKQEITVETEEEEALAQEVDSYVRFVPKCKAKSQSGKVGIAGSAMEYSYDLKLFEKLPLQLGFGTGYIGIENTTNVELPAHLTAVSTGAEVTLPFFGPKRTYLRLGFSPSFYGDDWEFETSSFRLPVRTFLIYQPDDKWTFVGGVAVYPDFEESVFPIAGFIYKPNDRLEFNLVPERPNITYKLNRILSVFTEGSMAYGEYEVDKDNLENVVLIYEDSWLGAGLKFTPNKFIRTYISVGGVFNRTIKYKKEELGKVDIKNGLYSELRMEITW